MLRRGCFGELCHEGFPRYLPMFEDKDVVSCSHPVYVRDDIASKFNIIIICKYSILHVYFCIMIFFICNDDVKNNFLKYYFNIFLSKNTLKNSRYYTLKHPFKSLEYKNFLLNITSFSFLKTIKNLYGC
jgi:hypothetical protein